MTDLLKVARILGENQVEVAKIQLKDVARTWWLGEEARLEKPISWDNSRRASMRDFSLQLLEGDGGAVYQAAAVESIGG